MLPLEASRKVGWGRLGHQAGRQRQRRHAQRLRNADGLHRKQVVHQQAPADTTCMRIT